MARAVFNDNNGRTRRVFDFIESGKNGEIFRDGIEYFSLYRRKLQSFRKSRSTSISSRCSTHEPRRWVGANPSIEPSLADQENDPPSLIIDAARSMDRACARANSAALLLLLLLLRVIIEILQVARGDLVAISLAPRDLWS